MRKRISFCQVLCSIPCYLTDFPSQASYDFIGNVVFPIAVIATANVALIIRVIQQKRRHNASWQRQRKLTVQLVLIAILYMIFWFPLSVNGLIASYTSAPSAIHIQVNYFFFLLYMVPLLLPFVSLSHLPNFFDSLLRKETRAVRPLTNTA